VLRKLLGSYQELRDGKKKPLNWKIFLSELKPENRENQTFAGTAGGLCRIKHVSVHIAEKKSDLPKDSI
jgi:hypothetical protein